MIAKQQAKREQTYPVCLHTVEKYEKVESITAENDYEITSQKWTDKKKKNLFYVFCKSDSIPRKQVQDCLKEFLGNNNNISWKCHQSKWLLHDKHRGSKAEDWQ